MATVKINFSNDEAAKQFVLWLDGQGEQDYWTWMEERECQQPEGDITATQFKYNFKTFNVDAVCGRMDK